MNKFIAPSIAVVVVAGVLAFGALPASAFMPAPLDLKTHPADPPDNGLPPPIETAPVQPPSQPVDSARGKEEPTNTFDTLDTNRDGYLTRVEFSMTNTPASDFERFDSDHDGRMSKEEWLRAQSPLNKDR